MKSNRAPERVEITPIRSAGEGRDVALHEIIDLLQMVLEQKRAEQGHDKRVMVTWLRSPERNLPVKARINTDDFVMAIGALIDRAIESLGGEGVVRIGVNPGVRLLQIAIEDNGRGIDEEFVLRLKQKGVIRMAVGAAERPSFQQVKELIQVWGGRVQCVARLGVGSRVSVELPRVDSFAMAYAISHASFAEAVQESY